MSELQQELNYESLTHNNMQLDSPNVVVSSQSIIDYILTIESLIPPIHGQSYRYKELAKILYKPVSELIHIFIDNQWINVDEIFIDVIEDSRDSLSMVLIFITDIIIPILLHFYEHPNNRYQIDEITTFKIEYWLSKVSDILHFSTQ